MAIQKLGFSGTPNLIHSVGGVGYLTTTVAGGSLVAPSSGTASKMYVYKYAVGTNAIGNVALYDSALALLVSASFNLSGDAGWREVTIADTAIVSGSTYYPMLLVANGNSLMYSDTSGNNCSRVGSLLTPPDPWTEIQNRAYCSAVYVEWDDGASGSIVPILAHHLQIQGAL